MSQKIGHRSPVEEGLVNAMQSLDRQILREVSTRTPGQREEHGIQKWEPIEKRIELVSSFILNQLGDDAVGLDSLLVLAQAFAKSLQIVAEDLGTEGLGEVRSKYMQQAFEFIEKSGMRGAESLKGAALLS